MAQKDIKLSDLTASLVKLGGALKRRAAIIFIVAILAGLVYSVMTVNLILNAPSDDEYRTTKESQETSTQFDKATIQRIDALGDRQTTPAPTLPAGRINPFIE